MSQMIDQLVRIDPATGRGTMRNMQTGTEYSVILGRAVNAGATLVAFADISKEPIPAPAPQEGETPEDVQAAAVREQEELRLRMTAQARGLSPDEVTAADVFPGGQAPTALPTEPPMTGYEHGVAGGVTAPQAVTLDEAERQELEAYRAADAAAQAEAQEEAGVEGVEDATARAKEAAAEEAEAIAAREAEAAAAAEAKQAQPRRRRAAARAKQKD